MQVRHILERKGREVVTTSPETTLEEAARLLKSHRIGALVVTDGDGRVLGIVSERDIVNALAEHGAVCGERPVSEVMTEDLAVCTPEDTTDTLMEVMTRQRVRHLPVIEDGRLAGIVSIGDVVKSRMEEIAFEAEQMKMYIATG